METEKRRKRLNTIYGIKSVGGGEFRTGFYDGIDFFDKKINKFLKQKGIYQEFMNFLAKEQETSPLN